MKAPIRNLLIVSTGAILALAGACDSGPTLPSQGEDPGSTIQASHVSPEFVDGNPICTELFPKNEGILELKIDGFPDAGVTYTSDDDFLEFTVDAVTNSSLDWSSNVGVDGVYLKAGSGGNLYAYDPEATTDDGLVTPESKTISHVTICYDMEYARISIEPDGTNEVGDAHTFTVTVEGILGDSTGAAASDWDDLTAADVDFTLTDANGASSVLDADASTCDETGDNVTIDGNGDGTCAITFTSNSAGTVTGHASATATIGNAAVSVETDGEGHNSDDAVKTYVDARIQLSPLTATNGITEDHVITADVDVDDGSGSGWTDAPDGTVVSFSLSNNTANADFVDDGSDDDSNGTEGDDCTLSGGTCAITINGDTEGDVDIGATTDVTVGGLTLTRTTGTGSPNSADAQKDYLDGELMWTKVASDTEALLGGATFEVCRTHDWDSDTGTMVDVTDDCVSVTDNAAPDADADDGEFLLEDLVLGRYTIEETGAPAGYIADDEVKTEHLTTSSSMNQPVSFVNTPEGTTGGGGDPGAGTEGCTPGYWKNRGLKIGDWTATGYSSGQSLSTAFNFPVATALADWSDVETETLLDALQFHGGSTVEEAGQILLRAAVAALLNAAHPDVDYPETKAQVEADVNQAISEASTATNREEARKFLLTEAEQLDEQNNLGCPLGSGGGGNGGGNGNNGKGGGN